jgi:hypothetical protein
VGQRKQGIERRRCVGNVISCKATESYIMTEKTKE